MPREVTLADLVEGLGYELVNVAVAPRGLAVPVGDPVIHDRVAGTGFAAADVVLAVGIDERGSEILDLLAAAGSAGVTAVVVKLDGDEPADAMIAAADRAGVALISVSREVEWGQLHALARMVTSTGRSKDESDDPLLGDLFALANAIAVRAHASVTIEDRQSRVLAYSTGDDALDEYRRDTILGRRVPESWVRRLQDDGVFERIWQGDGPVSISYSSSDPDYRDRLVVAVRAGGEVVGSIWIQEGDEPLGPEHERLLVEVAPLTALHLVRHFAGDVERRQESELLRAALAGRVPTATVTDLVDVRPGQRVVVLGLEPRCADEVEAAMHLRRLTSVVALYRRSTNVQLTQTASSTQLHVLVVAGDRMSAILHELVERVRGSTRVGVNAAVAESIDGLNGLVEATREVDDVLAVCDSSTDRIVTLSDVVGLVALARWRRAARTQPELCRGRVELLVRSDLDKGTRYVETLQSYLDHFGDVATASAALDVHPNTFRYRLRRAVATAGIDLDDPIERLMANLHLQLLEAPEPTDT